MEDRKILKDISFVTTVYNEEKSISAFLGSLLEQECLPGEIILIDGGSSDNTLSIVRGFFKNNIDSSSKKINIKIIERQGANISKGRNIAIKNANSNIICVSDAGCILDRNWIGEITRYYDDKSCHMVGGFNSPLAGSFLEKCLAVCIMPGRKEIKSKKYMPSSRNLSFRKSLWKDAGGYPEFMDYGEDMRFNFNVRARGYDVKFNPDAVVYWKMRDSMVDIFKQFFRYAKGDAVGKMYLYRHLIRFFSFAFFIAVIVMSVFINLWILMIIAPLFVIYIYKPYSRVNYTWNNTEKTKSSTAGKFFAVLFIPLLQLYIDFAKLFGYIYGLARRSII